MAEGVAVVGIATALASSVLDSSKAIKNFKDAPVDLVELANQVQSFASVFTFMRSHSVQGNAQVLRRATECLSEIDALMRRHVSLDRPGRMKVMARFKWVIKDKEKVTSLVRELSDCTSIIGLWVATQNMYVTQKTCRRFSHRDVQDSPTPATCCTFARDHYCCCGSHWSWEISLHPASHWGKGNHSWTRVEFQLVTP